jgi:transcriptional regulator with XRE-family HTH domain
MSSVKKALAAESVEEVAEVMAEDSTTSLLFEQCLRPALFGHWTEVRLLVGTWHDGVLELLHSAGTTPDVTFEGEAPLVKTLGGEFDPRVVEAMHARVADIVTSPWISRFGDGLGASVTMVDVVRSGLPHGPGPLPRPPGFPGLPRGADLVRFRRLCDVALRGMQPPLEYLEQTFGLNRSELAALFGVSRQAVDQWEARGIPAQKLPLMADLTAMAELLDRKLKPGRLPILVRQPSPAYDGRSFLEMIKLGRHRELRDGLERAFDWSTAA